MAERDGVPEVTSPSGTVTFLFSDIEDSTPRWTRNRAAMQEAVRRHGGHVFKTIGDAFCVAFETPEAAALAALDSYPSGVFWVNAETTRGLTGGFVEIAAALGLPAAASNDHETAVKAVMKWLNGTSGWLLILDNVDDRCAIQAFVPDSAEGHVLMTSREPIFAEVGIPRALEVSRSRRR